MLLPILAQAPAALADNPERWMDPKPDLPGLSAPFIAHVMSAKPAVAEGVFRYRLMVKAEPRAASRVAAALPLRTPISRRPPLPK